MSEHEWLERAACRGVPTSTFYPTTHLEVEAVKATYCANCPVVGPCLEWAIHNEPYGVWGGTSERARVRIRRRLGIHMPRFTYTDPAYQPEPEPDEEWAEEEPA